MELLSLDNFECQRRLIRPAIDFWQSHPKLSFEDCLIAETARARAAVPLWTFDHKLATQHPAAQEVP